MYIRNLGKKIVSQRGGSLIAPHDLLLIFVFFTYSYLPAHFFLISSCGEALLSDYMTKFNIIGSEVRPAQEILLSN
jgi:hypothetical protein